MFFPITEDILDKLIIGIRDAFDDKELRYGIFSYNPGKEEYISGGVKSWAEK
mgnify:CR=1 FL=1